MYIPGSTYRLQANCNFKLHDMKGIVRYLDQLGISTVYCAPFFQSRCGSNHGYDVINPHVINPELGTLEELRELALVLANRKMGWLQDIVPNHMAYDYTNVWLRDVFEKGIHSDYVDFFDIDWKHGEEQ
ncbi:MAG: malto-oligosyltrehalose synthase, partial [Cytophagaceae bacterium]|nr:malto-oligosyltrehalose synthase [Cytophagaceae bacterium]